MDICNGVYFGQFRFHIPSYFIFAKSSETEVGSAGEQPARDSLMLEVNYFKIAARLGSYLL